MVFKEQLERQERPSEPPIPIRILVEEHEMLLQISTKLLQITDLLRGAGDFDSADNTVAEL